MSKTWVKVAPGIYIGNNDSVRDTEFIKQEDVKVIIDVAGQGCRAVDGASSYYYALNDQEYMPNEFDRAYKRVMNIVESLNYYALEVGHVLVCSRECINRAPLITALYLVGQGHSAADAISTLEKANTERDPNARTLINKSFRKMISRAEAEYKAAKK